MFYCGPHPLAKLFATALLVVASPITLGFQPATAQAAAPIDVTNFNIPPQGAPGNREAGGLRSDTCADTSTDAAGLMAIVPNTNVGLTLQASPHLFAYVPPNNATRAELLILHETTQETVFDGEISLPADTSGSSYQNKASIVDIPLASAAITLQPNESYLWALMLVCNDENRAEDIVVQTVVQRVGDNYRNTLPDEVNKQLDSLDSVSMNEQLAAYSSAGLWQDLLAELLTLTQTDATTYTSLWSGLLTNQGMSAISDMPVYTTTLQP